MRALKGDLSEFPLTDIIQLVDLSKKTGGVHISGLRGTQRLEGWIYFRDGKIIGAELPDLSPLEAVYAFFTLASGSFSFIDNAAIPQSTITVSNEVIIMEGIMRQDAWNTMQQQAPSLNMVPRLVPNPSSGATEINLEAEEWRVLTMVNGQNTVAQISHRSGLGEMRTCEIISQLLSNGLIDESETNATETVMPELERIAANALGNNAGALLQEVFTRVNITNPTNANSEQIFAALNYFEQAIIPLLGNDRAGMLVNEMRRRAQELLG